MFDKLFFTKNGQISESLALGIFLTLAGGFQDAYSYNVRDHVFANAQTGNIVLLGQNIVIFCRLPLFFLVYTLRNGSSIFIKPASRSIGGRLF